jgi:flagellar biogenesis protein FliO
VAWALGGVIALILVLRWAGQRALASGGVRGGRSAAVRVLSRTVLAPRQQVLLLHVGRRVVVVGDSGGRMSTLCEIAEPDEVASLVGAAEGASQAVGDSAKVMFGSMFRRAKEPFTEQELSDGSDVLAVSRNIDGIGEQDVAQVGGLLEKVRLMRSQFNQT